jgi:hypothetical protein
MFDHPLTFALQAAKLPGATKPYCYNRPLFVGEGTVWIRGCPHWRPGGNAWLTPVNIAAPVVPWERCDGCIHKEATNGSEQAVD